MASPERSRLRSATSTGRFTARLLRSAFSSWRASIRRGDALAACVVAVLALALAAYLLVRAQAAAHLAFTTQAQRVQMAVSEKLVLPKEDLSALSRFLQASGGMTRRQFDVLTSPLLLNHRMVYAFEWLPLVRDSERASYEAEARAAGLTDYRFWDFGPGEKPRESPRRESYVP